MVTKNNNKIRSKEMKQLVELVNGSRKAIVAFVVTALVAWVARKGYNIDVDTQTALRTLLDSLIAGVLVWLTANKK